MPDKWDSYVSDWNDMPEYINSASDSDKVKVFEIYNTAKDMDIEVGGYRIELVDIIIYNTTENDIVFSGKKKVYRLKPILGKILHLKTLHLQI